jgi:hypothetical protein
LESGLEFGAVGDLAADAAAEPAAQQAQLSMMALELLDLGIASSLMIWSSLARLRSSSSASPVASSPSRCADGIMICDSRESQK